MGTYVSWLEEEISRLRKILNDYGVQWEPAKPFDTKNCDHERTETQGGPKPDICLDCGEEL